MIRKLIRKTKSVVLKVRDSTYDLFFYDFVHEFFFYSFVISFLKLLYIFESLKSIWKIYENYWKKSNNIVKYV